MRFDNKVVVVTGGASGIGLAATRRFSAEGAMVVIADVNDALGEAAARDLGPERALYVHTDVAAWDQVGALMRRAADTFGGLDVVFNNAASAASPPPPTSRWTLGGV